MLEAEFHGNPEAISSKSLAFVGDAVYTLMVREKILFGNKFSDGLSNSAAEIVNAKSQSAACDKILSLLTSGEKEVLKRGRNMKTASRPKNATSAEYAKATGLETLFGYLYLTDQNKRLTQLISVILSDETVFS